jgi:hypothetical protein
MVATFTPFGPGTITLGATPLDFSCEVLGGKVTHTYEEVGESRTMMCGTERPASRKRLDGLGFDVENDLTAAGLYQYLLTGDLTTVAFAYTPNTAKGAKWAGSVQLTLPGEIGASEYGAPIVSSVEWEGVGAFTFTAATVLEDPEADTEAA